MKKILIVWVFILTITSLSGCFWSEKNPETPERISKNIELLEKKLSNEDDLYDQLWFVTSSDDMAIYNEMDFDQGYDKKGSLEKTYQFDSKEYRIITKNYIDKYTDRKLLGRYYIDENNQVYYFSAPLNPYHTGPLVQIALLENEDLFNENTSGSLTSDEMTKYNQSNQVMGYNKDGMLNKKYQFPSSEYKLISPNYIETFDLLIIGQYYVDENNHVYFFAGPSHLKP